MGTVQKRYGCANAAAPVFLPLVRIFSLLSAILHLGNIRYKRKTYRDDSIDICNPEVLPFVSELLEVSAAPWAFPPTGAQTALALQHRALEQSPRLRM